MHQPLKRNKKELSPEQRKALLRALKARFEENMNRHRGLEWAEVQAKRRANTFFMIVQRKVLKAAEVFATTVKRWSQGENINQRITLLIWRLPWALSF
jgi:NOL1/NOP2/fmu family ribosome biogenesis protein